MINDDPITLDELILGLQQMRQLKGNMPVIIGHEHSPNLGGGDLVAVRDAEVNLADGTTKNMAVITFK